MMIHLYYMRFLIRCARLGGAPPLPNFDDKLDAHPPKTTNCLTLAGVS